MSVKITYFVHGTTTDNEKNISSGWKDVELSELGVKQSKELLQKIKERRLSSSQQVDEDVKRRVLALDDDDLEVPGREAERGEATREDPAPPQP